MTGRLFITALAIFATWGASAQQTTLRAGDIPHLPTDTLSTDRRDVRIVTFSDGTFRFIPSNPFGFRSAEAYGAHWDTINLFAYRDVELGDLPEVTHLNLTDSARTQFRAPAVGRVLSKYGVRGRRNHNGTDIQVAHGQPVYAALDGIVRFSRWNSGGFGNLIVVRHRNGMETYYAHLSRRAVVAGEWVAAGQVIGYGGRTGRASGNHLHFETRFSDQSFDPERLIDFETGGLRHADFELRKEYFSISSRAVEGIESDPDEVVVADSLGADAPAPLVDSLAAGGGTQADAGSGRTAEPEPVYHTIKSGDTLLALALHYDTTVGRICTLNGIARTTTLRIGKKLRIR